MPNTTITGLPSAGTADPNAVVAADNASGTLTEKVTLQQIADLATVSLPSGTADGDVLTWNSYMSSWGPSAPTAGIPAPQSPSDGDVLTYDSGTSEWVAAAPTGGNTFDQTLNTTDAVTFLSVAMDNGSSLSEGSFDNATGGANGISLNCVVGYELNWQGGHLACTQDSGVTYAPILCDSPLEFPGAGPVNMQVTSSGITFPDGSSQGTAGIPAPGAPNDGDVLSYATGNSTWNAVDPSTLTTWQGAWDQNTTYIAGDFVTHSGVLWRCVSGGQPSEPGTDPNYWTEAVTSGTSFSSGNNDGEVLTWDSGTSTWGPAAPTGIPDPGSASDGDFLAYDTDTSSWIAVAPPSGTLPSGTEGYYLQYISGQWTAAQGPPINGSGNNEGDLLSWDNTNSYYTPRGLASVLPAATTDGDVLSWNATNSQWVATAATGGGIPAPPSPTQGDILVYDTGSWVSQAPSSGLPSGMSNGDVLTWDSTSSTWASLAPAAQVPTSANANDILAWNGSAWAAVMPSTPGLPSAANGQALVFDGINWIAGSPFPSVSSGQYLYYDGTNWGGGSPLPSGTAAGEVLTWDSGMSVWTAAPPSLATSFPSSPMTGDVLTWDANNNVWTSAAPVGIPAPPTPSDGDVLTYSTANSAWESAPPTGGTGLSAQHARVTTAETSTEDAESNSTILDFALDANSQYLVHGFAYLMVAQDAPDATLGVVLSNQADGDALFDFDRVDGQPQVYGLTNTNNATVVVASNLDNAMSAVGVAVRFQGYVLTDEAATNLRVRFGTSDGTVTLEPDSWMTVIKLS